MYARILTLKSSPDKRSDIEAVADQVFAMMKTLRGFVSVHFVISPDETEYGSFSLWESKEDAEAAGDALRPGMSKNLMPLAAEPPKVYVYEVYKPG